MTRTIANEVRITLEGIHNNGNCKEVYCITDSRTFASVQDAADAAGVSQGYMSYHLRHKTNSCGGKQYCFLRELSENHDRISMRNRIAIDRVENLEEGNKTLAAQLETVTNTANEAVTTLNAIRMASAQVDEAQREVTRLTNELEQAKFMLTKYRANLAEAITNSANIAFDCQ